MNIIIQILLSLILLAILTILVIGILYILSIKEVKAVVRKRGTAVIFTDEPKTEEEKAIEREERILKEIRKQ